MAIAEPTPPAPMTPPTAQAAASGKAGVVRGLVVLVAAVGLSLAALLAVRGHEARVPPDEALAAAVANVRSGFQDGDAVVVLPNWHETVWQPLVGTGEGLDRWPFPALQRGDQLDPLELLRFRRAWVLATYGKAPALPLPGLAALAPAERTDLGGGVSVARYDLPALDHRARLTDAVDRLRVRRTLTDGRVVDCPWRAGSHRCGLDPWLDPHVEWRNVFHREVGWLYAHPGPGNAVLSMTWSQVPTGAALVVRVGFNQKAVRSEPGGPAIVRTYVDDQHVDTVILSPHRYVLERRLVALPAGRASHRIRFEVQADPPDWRQVMLEADVLGNLPEPLEAWLSPAQP